MESPIRIAGVWKYYGSRAAVRGLSFNVPAQSVYGFLGPNGAGKSTTIRMLLGLQHPDRGTISLFGQPLSPSSLKRIGSLVEAPSLYLHLTGRENLEVHRRLVDLPKKSVSSALETVGLLSSADRVVRGYSSGMKQRLGLAQALLGNPELLLLDEPTNGLDPSGIHEIRSLIRDLPKQRGVTIFLSTHLLAEVEQVGTNFAIISEGQLRFEGTAEELKHRSKPTVVAEVNDMEMATVILQRAGISFEIEDGLVLMVPRPGLGAIEINELLVRGGIRVSQLVTKRSTLEDTFLELTAPGVQAEELVETRCH